jgi:hypothetical protein
VPAERASRTTIAAAAVTITAVLALLVVGFVAGARTRPFVPTGGGAVSAADPSPTTVADVISAAPAPTTAVEHAGPHDATQTVAVVVPGTGVDPSHANHDHTATVPGPEVAVIPSTTATTRTAVATDATQHQHVTTVPAPSPTTTTTAAPAGPIISLDDPRLTPAQRAAAVDLIDRTRTAMQAFPDEAAVVRAGYQSIGDAATGFEHFVSWGYLLDGHEVDPAHIESIVLRVSGSTKTVESAMYILTVGKTMADVPDIAGSLTTWHDHQNLCFSGTRVVGVTGPDGTCAEGQLLVTPPMLHVWLTEQPCGPFAGIETSGHGGGCHPH